MNNFKIRNLLRYSLFFACLLFILFPQLFRKIYANDFWKALYSGRYLSFFYKISHHSAYTHSPVKSTTLRGVYNWLGNFLLYNLYEIGGFHLTQVFRGFVGLFMVILYHSILRFKANSLVLFALVVSSFGIDQKLHLRTALFAIPFLSVLLWFWFLYKLNQDFRWIWPIPFLLTLWSNIHGSFLVGWAIFMLMLIGEIYDRYSKGKISSLKWPAKLFLVIIVSTISVTWVKPYPDLQILQIPNRLVKSIQDRNKKDLKGNDLRKREADQPTPKNASVVKNNKFTSPSKGKSKTKWESNKITNQLESGGQWSQARNLFQSIVIASIPGADDQRLRSAEFDFPLSNYNFIFVNVGFAIGLFTLFSFLYSIGSMRLSLFLPFMGAFILGLCYVRTVPYISLTAIPILFMKYRMGDFDKVSLGVLPRSTALLAIMCIILTVSYHVYHRNTNRIYGSSQHKLGWGTVGRFTKNVPDYLLKQYPDKKFYSHYNQGGYLIWNWWPYKKVFIDSKSSAYKKSVRLNFSQNSPAENSDKYNLNYTLLPTGNISNYLDFIPNPNWSIIAFDQGMMAFHKVSSPVNVEPLDVTIISKEVLLKKSPEFKRAIKNIVEFIEKHQNNGASES